ncbi:ubiquitinyl hydrolase 1 [Cryomyces antarcticus]|uniref:Ubiquitin carboxyl-terminal hydrolase n=1 Tax=Cryomyces antarcticus TaxID=329879 RepID=A0ABR0LRW6_9PEZI|nr:hypothetical protein LTR39_000821 [Cryomyces antarcticus]KAK5020288.1 hypothetical protein LTR60_000657 [Cryomyces antarcticus]KAK5201834.1 ubiquitinyl hydrolase 1 [Cryomyces antarcticus]
MWFKQTINNACGLYSILHAICNGDARNFIPTILESCTFLPPQDRALVLEGSEELESVYGMAALQGNSMVPTSAEDEVDFHFVCFVKSHINGHIYELDGDRKGPVDKGPMLKPDDDILAHGGLAIVREFIQRERDGNSNFSLMALVPT